jgi:hypothetical protein
MRRLTLILSDLYLPAEASSEDLPAAMAALPNLDALLRFAPTPIAIVDWRRWLATHLEFSGIAEIPVATLAAGDSMPPPLAATAWLAVPVRLEARLDHVRLMDRGLLRIAPAERVALIDEFARSFGPQYTLHDAGERAFLLSGLAAVRVATLDPSRLLDTDISSGIAMSGEARELRRLASEIDMWMHGSALNIVRDHAGVPRISSLWLWGGGVFTGELSLPAETGSTIAIYGGDPWLAGLARCAARVPMREPPPAFANLATSERAVVELAPMSGAPREALATLDAQWFAPMRASLANGELAEVHLVANDLVFRIGARCGWRLWRRKQSWLARLKERPRHAKA